MYLRVLLELLVLKMDYRQLYHIFHAKLVSFKSPQSSLWQRTMRTLFKFVKRETFKKMVDVNETEEFKKLLTMLRNVCKTSSKKPSLRILSSWDGLSEIESDFLPYLFI